MSGPTSPVLGQRIRLDRLSKTSPSGTWNRRRGDQQIEHRLEKVVLGVIGLFVLICLAGTSWSRYDKQPEEFTKKVEQGEAAIRNSAGFHRL